MKVRSTFVIGLVAVLAWGTAGAQEVDLRKELTAMGETRKARTTEGVIHELDLGARSAVIGGYTYVFGPPNMPIPVKVKMYGSNYGAIELLQTGMKVKVIYGDTGNMRVALQIEQLAPNAEIKDY